MCADVATLTRLINNEVILAMGLPTQSWAGERLQPILSRATRRFSEIFAKADAIVAARGLPDGARWLLLNLAKDVRARGIENIPKAGPLVIASNHPGTVDSLALATTTGRGDLKIIASDVPFLQNLSHISEHLILLPRRGIQARMIVMREALRHLREGGSLLLFARGGIDPDPAFMPGGDHELVGWSRSLEIFLRSVPNLRVVASIVSNVIEPSYMRHPLTWLRRARPDRQRLAMMIQIIQQMLGRQLDLVPRVSFGPAITAAQVGETGSTLERIIDAAKCLLESHLAWQP